jgi:hypothetical protein
MAHLRETADFYSPVSMDEEWEEHPDRVNIEEDINYLLICPKKGIGRKNDPPLAAHIPIPPWPHELWLLFPVMFNMNDNNSYNGLDMNIIKRL